MKAMNFLKSVFVVACIFVANLTISASNPEANLIYRFTTPKKWMALRCRKPFTR